MVKEIFLNGKCELNLSNKDFSSCRGKNELQLNSYGDGLMALASSDPYFMLHC